MATNMSQAMTSASKMSKQVAGGVRWDTTSLMKGLLELDDRLLKALLMFGETQAISLRADMQKNRPWTDRSGDAKKYLGAKAEIVPTGVRISLFHGVQYGLWLELAHEGNYAILEPTVRLQGPEVARRMRGLLERIKGVS